MPEDYIEYKVSLLKRAKCVTESIVFLLLDNKYIIKVVTKARKCVKRRTILPLFYRRIRPCWRVDKPR